jgi:hypothetical protein
LRRGEGEGERKGEGEGDGEEEGGGEGEGDGEREGKGEGEGEGEAPPPGVAASPASSLGAAALRSSSFLCRLLRNTTAKSISAWRASSESSLNPKTLPS